MNGLIFCRPWTGLGEEKIWFNGGHSLRSGLLSYAPAGAKRGGSDGGEFVVCLADEASRKNILISPSRNI